MSQNRDMALSWGRPAHLLQKNIVLSLSEAVEAKLGWLNKNWMFYIKYPYLRIQKNIDFWLECHWIKKKNARLKCINSNPQTLYIITNHCNDLTTNLMTCREIRSHCQRRLALESKKKSKFNKENVTNLFMTVTWRV